MVRAHEMACDGVHIALRAPKGTHQSGNRRVRFFASDIGWHEKNFYELHVT